MRTSTFLLVLVALGLLAAPPAHAQAWKRLADRAKAKVEQKIGEKQDEAIDKAVDNAVDGPASPAAPGASAPAAASSDGASSASAGNAAGGSTGAAALRPGEGIWANYDFVPGERPLFVDDFSADRVGNFPRRLEFREGNFEVVEWEGQRLLRSTAQGAFAIPLPETLPERFTIEFDAHNADGEWLAVMTADQGFEGGALNYSQFPGSYFLSDGYAAGLEGKGPEAKTATKAVREGLAPVRITVDGTYAKMYIGEHRVANVPNANVVRGNKLHVITWYAHPDRPTYIGNVRVMAGGRELYDAIAAEGRVATQGILFDTGSDRIRPESTPTLQEIGDMLSKHGDLRLRIEGHTDNVGDDAANLSLSERRAAAVKAYLAEAHGIAADRLESAGLGETAPAASNDTPEGRQQNRRVELVKL